MKWYVLRKKAEIRWACEQQQVQTETVQTDSQRSVKRSDRAKDLSSNHSINTKWAVLGL